MKTPASHDSPTPQAFSARHRRLDPLLEAEDTNHLFEAFQRRRTLHRLRFVDLLGQPGAGTMKEHALDRFKIFGLAVIVTIFTCGIAYPFAVIAASMMNIRSRVSSTRLPSSLMFVFSTRGFVDGAAMDIVQTGCSGRDVIEAIYLEGRLMQMKLLRWVCIVIAVGANAAYFWGFRAISIEAVCLEVSLMVLLVAIYWSSVNRSIGQVAINVLTPRLIHWAADSPWQGFLHHFRFFAYFIMRLLLRTLLVSVPFVLLFFLAKWQGYLEYNWLVRHFYVGSYGTRGYSLLAAGTMLFIAGASMLGRRRMRERGIRRVAHCLELADAAFEHFVYTVMLDDPDARILATKKAAGRPTLDAIISFKP